MCGGTAGRREARDPVCTPASSVQQARTRRLAPSRTAGRGELGCRGWEVCPSCKCESVLELHVVGGGILCPQLQSPALLTLPWCLPRNSLPATVPRHLCRDPPALSTRKGALWTTGECGLAGIRNPETYARTGWAVSPPARSCPGPDHHCRRLRRSCHLPPPRRGGQGGWRTSQEKGACYYRKARDNGEPVSFILSF